MWWQRRTAKSSCDGLLGFLANPLITRRVNVCQKTTSQTRTQNLQRRTWITAGRVHCQTCAAAENIKDKFTPGRRQRRNMLPSLWRKRLCMLCVLILKTALLANCCFYASGSALNCNVHRDQTSWFILHSENRLDWNEWPPAYLKKIKKSLQCIHPNVCLYNV